MTKTLLPLLAILACSCMAGNQKMKVIETAKFDTGCQTYAIKGQMGDGSFTRYVLVGCGKRLVYRCSHASFDNPYGPAATSCEKVK